MIAALKGKAGVVKTLLENGANKDLKNPATKQTATDIAKSYNREEVIKVFKSFGTSQTQ